MIKGPTCLNCEKKKTAPYPITLDQKSGFICEECYKGYILAQKDNRKQSYLLDTALHTKLFSMRKDGR